MTTKFGIRMETIMKGFQKNQRLSKVLKKFIMSSFKAPCCISSLTIGYTKTFAQLHDIKLGIVDKQKLDFSTPPLLCFCYSKWDIALDVDAEKVQSKMCTAKAA